VALGAFIVIMLLVILGGNLFSPSHWHKDFKIGLGLDLSSGTEVTMVATTPTGGVPSGSEMSEAESIILSRVNGTGNSGATVQTEGNNIINVSVPGKTTQQTVQLVSSTALLRFRQVLLYSETGNAKTTTTTPSAKATASPTATPSPSATASPTAKPSPSATPNATSTASTSAKIVPDATASASPSASAKASASPSAHASASPSPSPSASSSSSASTIYGDSSLVQPAVLKLFNKLTCKQGDNDDTWKAQVGYTQSQDWDNPAAQIVSCNTTTGEKYVLDKTNVLGEDVTGAAAALSTTNSQWQVNLTFNGTGTSTFGTLTTNMYNKYYSGGEGGNEDDVILDQVAMALDGDVVSTAEIDQPITAGDAQITGSFTQAQANQLVDILKYGSLPVKLTPQSIQSVSPTLGRNQLNAGLLAGALGLILVVVYSFLYYRGLGVVSISSLIIAAMIGYLGVILLSKYESFTLDLAGIAGLIVAIGITADSFVVFFERLRDEVREGKQLRPAVESGWKRARRTILVSDTVSFLAALLLYYFAISDVKGFAFTLGMTTLIDVVVVFLFTKPMVTLVARTRFYGGGHKWSGLDPARLGARAPWRSSVRRVRTTTGTSAASNRNTGEA
jgi:preprotein translocase subunit SecD